jgi:biopolymer transport protein ExbD
MPFNPDTVVLIAADANAPYQDVARAMDAASQLGYSHIQLQGQSKQ